MKNYMKAAIVGVLALLSTITFTGCTSTGTVSPVIINAAAGVLHEGAYQGAAYAIQQNTNNVKYFVLADAALKTFATGQNLTPAAFETSLYSIDPALQNQWAQMGIDIAIAAYNVSYNQYVIGQVNSNAIAKQFVTAVVTGFDEALGPYVTNTVSLKFKSFPPTIARPSVVKVINSLPKVK